MPKTFAFLIIGLFFGTGLGFLLAAGSGARMEAHDHGAHNHTASHDHGALTEVTGPVPELAITLHPDGPQSRNLQIEVSHFTFAPEAVNTAPVPGQGHAHIYVNDIKIARVYSPWFHLDALPRGKHTVKVTLNANDHSRLAASGKPLEATTQVMIE